MKKTVFVLIMLIFSALTADVLNPVVNKSTVFLGEEVEATVNIAPSADMSAKFVKENKDIAITGVAGSQDKKSLEVKLVPLKNGEIEVPEIELTVSGKIYSVASFKITSQNRTQESDMNLRDIKETVKITEKDYTFLYISGALVILIGLFFLVKYLMKKFRKKKAARVPAATPFEVAMQFLKDARMKREQGDFELFTDLVTSGLRAYMSLKSGTNYREMTTYEIRRELKRDSLFSGLSSKIIDILKTGDRFKFADEELSEGDFDMIYSGFEGIVKEIEKSGVNSNAVS